jgi:hypothetical protein
MKLLPHPLGGDPDFNWVFPPTRDLSNLRGVIVPLPRESEPYPADELARRLIEEHAGEPLRDGDWTVGQMVVVCRRPDESPGRPHHLRAICYVGDGCLWAFRFNLDRSRSRPMVTGGHARRILAYHYCFACVGVWPV